MCESPGGDFTRVRTWLKLLNEEASKSTPLNLQIGKLRSFAPEVLWT